MGRKKIQISRILDQRNRQVTFTKRKFGLMKKAYELSVLCDCEIALIIFNSTNRLFQYASTDMDKVLLKYTEYSEPHESRTNADILETLRRKGLGLDGVELYNEEPLPEGKFQQLDEGVDLSVVRQRYYAPSLPPSEAQYLLSAGCENGFPVGNVPNPGLGSHRPPAFKPITFKHGSGSPAGPASHAGLIPPHSGIGYPMFSHANLSRALEMKGPPPLNLGCDGRRTEPHLSVPGVRPGAGSTRVLYHPGNHVMAMGKTEYPYPGFPHSVSLQRGGVTPWPPSQPQEAHASQISQGMSSGGCSLAAQTSSPAPPAHPSLNLSIKSERVSPEHPGSPATPPPHRIGRQSPAGNPETAGRGRGRPEPYAARDGEEMQKGSYPSQHGTAQAPSEDKAGIPIRQLEIVDGWQR
ncbi:myocyte-specific enhancer factor 2B isoform X2 [Scleropages formosus]|nr:myocyte-specific enhancer factor 2B isoform X2 [Scleropages formosus]